MMKLHTCEYCNGGGILIHAKNEIITDSKTSSYETKFKLFNKPTICEYCNGTGMIYDNPSNKTTNK